MRESVLEIFNHLSTFEWGVFAFFLAIAVLRMVYLILFSGRVAFLKTPPASAPEPVSLLLAFRNEEANLRKNLPTLLSLGNNDYEVVAVDDFSTDASLTVLGTLKRQDLKMHVSSMSQETHFSEKMARNIAIKAAVNEWLLFLTPTVSSFAPGWLSNVESVLNDDADVAVGYSNLKPNGKFVSLLFRVELFFQQLKSFGFILNGLPFVVAEENVAFKKQKYFEANGYHNKISESFAHLELLINSFMQKKTTLLLSKGEFACWEEKKVSFEAFFDLLKKEIRLKRFLSGNKRFMLFFTNCIELLFFPVAALLFVFVPALWPLIASVLGLVFIFRLFIIKRILFRLNERKLFLPSLLLALLRPYFKLVFVLWYRNTERKGNGRTKFIR
ncbi:Glycosyltransferase involved in cell wall bisynthesis [Mariniphaga anaerophila]|uniref:Glycosyltransferase involved in cell wall bisynthesis n=1 Tax=Mariniphaga anaerophila TaxID=1484053 RepID=A0A1M5DJZ1_9BACT|nr:glycosyltransferase [Mariniphaga anaerophila]SHF67214.1 Glycosyltransferase involved in cell wall bisynthesis [Mariniphaga anaerophila]